MSVIGTLTDSNYEALNSISNDALNTQKLENQTMGQDAFLELMMTQLANQDPLSPLDNQEMIAQMAQFSSVEQMGLVNENIQTTVEQNDEILEALLLMASQNTGNASDSSIEELIDKTDMTNELNTQILDELMKLNKAIEAYEG